MNWDVAFERMRARLHNRVFAYRACFRVQTPIDTQPWWAVWRKPEPDKLTQAAEIVMRDLAEYCYVKRPTLTVSAVTKQADPIGMAFAEGRRDVFNRIASLLELTSEDIERIAHRRSMNDE